MPASAWPSTVQRTTYVPGRSSDEAQALGLAGPRAGIDVGHAFDLPVVEDRVVVGERDDDDLAGTDGHVGRLEADVAGA